ncbi:hypothetical protein F1C76_20560 [Geodermatophilaceae bacterium NBWT11]|nr:hypothetical protein F1C76_20560 [Geodermatophilaceae bacterium NBWT11]
MTTHAPTTGTPAAVVRVLQVSTVLAALNVFAQFVTAGRLFPQGGPEELHAAGAIVLHVFSGVGALAALYLWRRHGAPLLLPALAVVVFLAGLAQAAVGGRSTLWVHVPGAMVLTAGVVWLLVLVFGPLARRSDPSAPSR